MLLPSVLHSLYNTQKRISFTPTLAYTENYNNGLSQCMDGNIDTVQVKYVVITHSLKLHYRNVLCMIYSKHMQSK
jgi:hypothetical protein